MRYNNTKLAIIFSLLASLCYAILAYTVKIAKEYLSISELIFFRQLIGLTIFFLIVTSKLGSYEKLKTKLLPIHLLRTICSLFSMFCLYFSLHHLPLTNAVLFAYTRPLFIPLILHLWFRRKWTKTIGGGTLIGFSGIVLILYLNDNIVINIASIVALGAGIAGAIAFTSIRYLIKQEPSECIIFHYMGLSLPFVIFPMALSWRTPTASEWKLLLLIGILAVAYQKVLSLAYRYGEPLKVATLLYSSVGCAYIIEIIIGKVNFFTGQNTPTFSFIIGMTCIVVGSVIALKNQKAI